MDRDQSIIGIIVVFLILMLLFFAASALGGAPGGGGGGGGGGAGVPCAGSSECPSGQICLNGLCVPAGSCGADADCPAGSLCVGGMCSDSAECSSEVPCPFGVCEGGQCTGCADAFDCAPGEICLNNVCSPSTPGCGSDTDCPDGYACINNVCTQSECSDLVPCPEGQKCVGTTCQDETCPEDFQCVLPKVCTAGSCVAPECGPGNECPPGEDCNELTGECEGAPCETSDDCPPEMECDPLTGECSECVVDADCPFPQECNDEGFCYVPCTTCTVSADCAEGQVCSRRCCASKTGFSLIAEPFGTYALMAASFCDGCPAQDSLVTRMFLNPRLEDKEIGVTLFVEADDGTRPSVEQGTVFVQILSLDMAEKKYCKMATDADGEANFNYSSYEFCDNLGCKITFTFCCADVSEGCLIPICLNDPSIQDLSNVPTTCPTGASGGGISMWPTKAQVDGEFVNLYPSIDSVSIPPQPKLMGVEFAFQLCFPILVIFGLLCAAMFASGRNPFEMFSLYTPRYKRAPERAIRPRGMNWNVNSMLSSAVSFAQGAADVGAGRASAKTGLAKGTGFPGITGVGKKLKGAMGDLKSMKGTLKSQTVSGAVKSGEMGGAKPTQTGTRVVGPGGRETQISPMVSMGGRDQLTRGQGAGLSGGWAKQLGGALAVVGGSLAVKMIGNVPGLSAMAYGGFGKDGLLQRLGKSMENIVPVTKALNEKITGISATFKEEEIKNAKGEVTGIKLTWTGEDGKQGTFTAKGNDMNSMTEQVSAKKSEVLAPLYGALSIVTAGAVTQKSEEAKEAFKKTADFMEVSPEMKKEIKDMKEKDVTDLIAKVGSGKGTLDDAYLAAAVLKESPKTLDATANDANGKPTKQKLEDALENALGGFVSSANFTTALQNDIEQANKNTEYKPEKGKVDATEVANKALETVAVLAHIAAENEEGANRQVGRIIQNSSIEVDDNGAVIAGSGTKEDQAALAAAQTKAGGYGQAVVACAGTTSDMMKGGEGRPGFSELAGITPPAGAFVVEANRQQLSETLGSLSAADQLTSAVEAQKDANKAYYRAVSEVFASSAADASSEMRSTGTLKTPETIEALKTASALTELGVGLGIVSEGEMKVQVAVVALLDPEGKYELPQSKQAEPLGVDPKSEEGRKNSAAALANAYVPNYLANQYNTDAETVQRLMEEAEKANPRYVNQLDRTTDEEYYKKISSEAGENFAKNRVFLETGMHPDAPGLAPEAKKSIDQLVEQRQEAFVADSQKAYENARKLEGSLASKNEEAREQAVRDVVYIMTENVPMMPEPRTSNGGIPPEDLSRPANSRSEQYRDIEDKISSSVFKAFPEEPSKTSVAEARQEKSGTPKKREKSEGGGEGG